MAIAAAALGASFLWLCWETRKVGKLATSVGSARADAKNLFHRLSRTRRQHHAGHVHNSYGSRGKYPPQRRLDSLKQLGYQIRQHFSGYMGWPLAHPNALPNSSKFCTVPLTRDRPGECGSAETDRRAERKF